MSTSDLTNQEKLEEIYKISLENNEILHRLQNRGRLTAILQVVYWLAIVGALGGVYYYIRPVIDSVAANGSRAEGMLRQLEELRSQLPETKAFQQFLNQIRSSTTEVSPAKEE